jgi:hypothetical protein
MDEDMDSYMAITPTTSYSQSVPFPTSSNPPKPLPSHPQFLSARNRTDSLMSTDTTYTVRTNVEQTQFFNENNPHLNFQRNRQNSNISLSSSVFSELPRPQMENYQFTVKFDDKLYSYYISYAQQPNITPFDIRFPPSGILSLISKLFLENCILNSDNNKIQIDSRHDINNDLLMESNRHSCLAVIRLRLIHLCNTNLNNNDDHFMFNDQLPISRTNSIASVVSFNDRVIPGIGNNNNNNTTTSNNNNNNNNEFASQAMIQRPSWLHMPNFYSNKSKENSTFNSMLSSTDSLLDRVQLQEDSTLDFNSVSNNNINNNTNNNQFKRERPLLNLHMPPVSISRSNSNLHHNMPPRPSFSIGNSMNNPLTPGTPNTPNTPGANNNSSQRNPRGVRSSSLTNAGPTYFNLPMSSSSNINNINNNHPGKSYINPTLNNIIGSPGELNSPFEQGFPSPLGFSVSSQLSNQGSEPITPTTSNNASTNLNATINSNELYNATATRKRDSLKLKRGLN